MAAIPRLGQRLSDFSKIPDAVKEQMTWDERMKARLQEIRREAKSKSKSKKKKKVSWHPSVLAHQAIKKGRSARRSARRKSP